MRGYLLDINRKVDDILIEINKFNKPKLKTTQEYFKRKNIHFFLDKTTKEVLKDYNDFKDSINPREDDMTLKQFNRIFKSVYPNIKIQRTTKNNKQIFVYRLESNNDIN